MSLRIASWNVNSLKARLGRVEEWIAEIEPDILCMQETKLADDAFPALTFQAMGYDSVHHGGGRWNGVAILSRRGLVDPAAGFCVGDAVPGGEARIVSATCDNIRVVSVYVPNGRSPDDPQYQFKLEWLAQLREHIATACDPNSDVVVCGDFNVAPDDRDLYDPAAFVGSTHVTPAERAAVADLCGWGLVDVFRRHYDQSGLFSWWDYRAGNFHKHLGMRIDLMLATKPLAERSQWALIDRNARKGGKERLPSDHAPVVIEFASA